MGLMLWITKKYLMGQLVAINDKLDHVVTTHQRSIVYKTSIVKGVKIVTVKCRCGFDHNLIWEILDDLS